MSDEQNVSAEIVLRESEEDQDGLSVTALAGAPALKGKRGLQSSYR